MWDAREIIITDDLSVDVLSVRQCSKGFVWIHSFNPHCTLRDETYRHHTPFTEGKTEAQN